MQEKDQTKKIIGKRKSLADIFPTDKNHKMHVETDELKVNMTAAVHHHGMLHQL